MSPAMPCHAALIRPKVFRVGLRCDGGLPFPLVSLAPCAAGSTRHDRQHLPLHVDQRASSGISACRQVPIAAISHCDPLIERKARGHEHRGIVGVAGCSSVVHRTQRLFLVELPAQIGATREDLCRRVAAPAAPAASVRPPRSVSCSYYDCKLSVSDPESRTPSSTPGRSSAP